MCVCVCVCECVCVCIYMCVCVTFRRTTSPVTPGKSIEALQSRVEQGIEYNGMEW